MTDGKSMAAGDVCADDLPAVPSPAVPPSHAAAETLLAKLEAQRPDMKGQRRIAADATPLQRLIATWRWLDKHPKP